MKSKIAMALPATHFRFALEAARHYEITHLDAYLSGTIYPDSRWITGIDRTKTHTALCLDQAFAISDFRLGWYVHCRCDQIQKEMMRKAMPRLDLLNHHQSWIRLSAAKMLQENMVFSTLDLDRCLAALDYIETPNNENPDKVARYYEIIRAVYDGRKNLGTDDFKILWQGVGLEPDMIGDMMGELKALSIDADARSRLKEILHDMLAFGI